MQSQELETQQLINVQKLFFFSCIVYILSVHKTFILKKIYIISTFIVLWTAVVRQPARNF